MAPRFSTIGSFSGVYSISGGTSSSSIDETVNYTGAVMLFQQTAAPTGWVKNTTNDDAILTTTTSTLSTGGTLGFAAGLNTTRTVSGAVSFSAMTIGATTITNAMLPIHTHSYQGYNSTVVGGGPIASVRPPNDGSQSPNSMTSPLGPYTGPTAHTHPNFGTTSSTTYFNSNFNIKYVDMIIATKS